MADRGAPHSWIIEVRSGEELRLPQAMLESLSEGRWSITVQPADDAQAVSRDHSAFLSGYEDSDEGLYDDCPAG